MAKILRLRRGNTAAHSTFTGKLAEVTVDTDKNTIVVHDNVTVGGHPLATESYVDNQVSNIIAGNLNFGDIDMSNNTISTVNLNQDLVLNPNGTGNVIVNSILKGNLIVSRSGFINGFRFEGPENYGLTGVFHTDGGNTPSKISIVHDGTEGLAVFNNGLSTATDLTVYNDFKVEQFARLQNKTIIGSEPTFFPAEANLQFASNANSYIQFLMQNTNDGASASTDLVATADNGTDSQGFIDVGINSSGYNDPAFSITGPNDGYLYVHGDPNIGGNLAIGTVHDKDIIFHTGGTTAADEIARFAHGQGLVVQGNVIPGANVTYNLGSPGAEWNSLYVSGNTIYIGGTPLSIDNTGNLLVNGNTVTGGGGQSIVNGDNSLTIDGNGNAIFQGDGPGNGVNRGLVWDYGAEVGGENSTVRQDVSGLSVRAWTTGDGGGPTNDGNGYSAPVNILTNVGENEKWWVFDGAGNLYLPEGGDILDSNGNSVLGGGGLPTITIPGDQGTTYKGLQVAYGMVHTNSQSDEYNVNKIVIHKPAVTTVTIDPTSNNDNFRVSGLSDSDVLAMFVFYGDTNGPKSLATLTAFAESVIDNVILIDGEAGEYRTVDDMKTAFHDNYATIALTANGLYANFEFYSSSVSTTNGGATTVRQGSGAEFTVTDNGDTTYSVTAVTAGGTNYLPYHQILVLGSSLGGADSTNDAIITVSTVDGNGAITAATISGTASGNILLPITGVSGTNYQVGNGLTVASVNYYNSGASLNSNGNDYVVGDVITLPGTSLQNGTSPANDITLTVTDVGGTRGPAYNFNVSGTVPGAWPSNYISDGGADQYDTANYISTNLATEINYNDGNTVVDGTAAFGEGSTYSFAYEDSIFAVFATGSSVNYIETSGNSGADGSSSTEAGHLYGPDTVAETYNNAVTHVNIIGDPYAGPLVTFVHADDSETVDILIADDGDGAGVGITRGGNNGIYNPYREGSWDSDVSPGGTLWNIDGWNDFADVETRTYTPLYEAFGFGGLGNKIVGTECVMYLPDNGKYYAVKFDSWTQGGNGGGFAYTRRELDTNNLQEGIRFADGTRLKSAEGLGRVKLESPGSRRIEEAYGYKSVTVTASQYTSITTTASRDATDSNQFWFDTTTTTIDAVLNNPSNYGIWESTVGNGVAQFSVDNSTWYDYAGSISGNGNEWGVSVFPNIVSYNQGDNIYFRYRTGAEPQVWWDKNDLPGSGANFRGAVIEYHAYVQGTGTMIGTIHIVNDSGDENVAHTEVFSGTTDGENMILWHQDNESQLKFKRIDSQASTLKVQWSAKIFYGSEFYDD